jgi:pyrophosphatase PpaX
MIPLEPIWPVVLWDFDGTIVDSVDAIVRAHHVATERVLGIRLPESEIRKRIGEPAHRRIADLVPERSAEVYAAYCEAFDALPPDETPVFPGILDVLDSLREAGATSALVTSRPRDHVSGALDHFGLGHHFATLVALEDTAEHKPAAAPLVLAMAQLGARADEAVYIGDAVMDLQSAAAAGIDSVAVTWGAGLVADLAAESPTQLAATPSQLASVLGVHDAFAA